jgi:general secretion pathway protein E
MGIEPFLLSSSLIGVLAQRLIRLLCKHCKKAVPATQAECALMGISSDPAPIIYHGVGCSLCRNTGYSGRSGVYELIAIDDTLRTMIHDKKAEQVIKKYARTLYPSIRQRVTNED